MFALDPHRPTTYQSIYKGLIKKTSHLRPIHLIYNGQHGGVVRPFPTAPHRFRKMGEWCVIVHVWGHDGMAPYDLYIMKDFDDGHRPTVPHLSPLILPKNKKQKNKKRATCQKFLLKTTSDRRTRKQMWKGWGLQVQKNVLVRKTWMRWWAWSQSGNMAGRGTWWRAMEVYENGHGHSCIWWVRTCIGGIWLHEVGLTRDIISHA